MTARDLRVCNPRENRSKDWVTGRCPFRPRFRCHRIMHPKPCYRCTGIDISQDMGPRFHAFHYERNLRTRAAPPERAPGGNRTSVRLNSGSLRLLGPHPSNTMTAKGVD